jgi:hypothetical protein
MGANPLGDAALRNPTTGIAGCCARAASGHTAAPQKRNELAAGVEIGPVALRQRLDHQLSCAHYPQESRENERTFAVLDEADDDCEPAVVREPHEDADHSTAERKF